MTASNDPDALRAEIEQTRARLSQDVNALGEAVTPGNIARRQVDKAKGTAVGIKDKVMGSAEDAAGTVRDRLPGGGSGGGSGGGMGESVHGMTTSVAGTVSNAPQSARTRAQGNPLAAGMIALGAGWLLGSLLPASEREREAIGVAKERAKEQAQPLVQEAKSVAQETAQNLKDPAMQAADSVRSTAQDAVQTVKAEGQQQAEGVRSSAQDSKETVQSHQSNPSTSL